MRVAVPVDNEATRIRLRPASLYLSRLSGYNITCQTTKVFIVNVKSFDLLHKSCVGDGERGGSGGEFLEHHILVCGGVNQVFKIAIKFFVLVGLSS